MQSLNQFNFAQDILCKVGATVPTEETTTETNYKKRNTIMSIEWNTIKVQFWKTYSTKEEAKSMYDMYSDIILKDLGSL